jgi:hypothetical protein
MKSLISINSHTGESKQFTENPPFFASNGRRSAKDEMGEGEEEAIGDLNSGVSGR